MMDPDDWPPLWIALSERDYESASKLIADGVALDDLIEEDGNTFLHDAAQDGDVEMVEFFLSHDCPLTLEQFDYVQQTPLIRAADNGKTDVVVRLLSARVNPNANDEHRIGNTAIREAVRGGHTDIVSLLLRAGADPTITGWMGISAVDQAWDEIESDNATIKAIRALLRSFPSSLRDKIQEQNKALYPNTDPPRD